MRKSTSRIVRLPGEVREEINRKMDAGWEYRAIRKWLFEEVAVEDVPALGLVKGEKFGLVWLRSGKSTEHAWHHCELALGNWFRVWHPLWVKQQVRGSESMRIIKRAAALTREAAAFESGGGGPPSRDRYGGRVGGPSDGQDTEVESAQLGVDGGNVIMRSVLIDAVSTIRSGSNDPKDIAQLANAWARLNAGKMEEEKLKLKTESKLEMAFKELSTELRNDPEAMELFNKLHAVVKRLEEKKSGKTAAPAG